MTRLHVLYVIDSLAPAGAERSLAVLAPHYRDLGVRLDVAVLVDRPGVAGELRAAGATVTSLAGPGGRAGLLRRATALVRERRPDLVHTTLYEADVIGRVAARLARTPVVSSLVSLAYGPEQLAGPVPAWKLRAAQALDVATARLVTRFHAVSTTVADEMAPRLRIDRARVDVIPRGREPAEMGDRTVQRRAAARAALGVAPAERLVLAVARHEHQKGLDVLLAAWPSVEDATLLVAGREGSATPALRAAAAGLQRVRLLGARDDVPDLLCAADVLAFPSRWEGLPGTLVEALAFDVPVVASDIGPVREVLAGVPGHRLVPPGDPAALAAALTAVVDHLPQARGRQRFLDQFAADRVAARMVAFYERALGR